MIKNLLNMGEGNIEICYSEMTKKSAPWLEKILKYTLFKCSVFLSLEEQTKTLISNFKILS